MISRKKSLREVYVWELPVRIFHWVNATAIVALCVTGYIIGNPPAIQHATPPEANYWFGWVRFIHFAAAFVFILNFIVRLYWAFAGNSFARWNNYLPLTRKQWRSIFDTTKVDVLLLSPKPVYDIGHNSLAAFTSGSSSYSLSKPSQDWPCSACPPTMLWNPFSLGYYSNAEGSSS